MRNVKRLITVFLMLFLVGCTGSEEETYSVTFHTNGGNEIDMLEYESGATIDMPDDPVKEGYIFEAWYTDEDLTGLFQSTEMPPFDIDLFAKWIEDTSNQNGTITITFIVYGGTPVPSAEYLIGDRMVQPPNPTRSGYEFIGWSTTQFCNSIYTFGDAPDDDEILYACWEQEEDNGNPDEDITITFNSNGGSTISSMTVTPGDTITAPTNPTRSGYTFGGWYTDSSFNNLFSWGTAPSSNITLYAKWIQDTVDTYTISFQSNGGTSVSSQTVEEGQSATEPNDPTRNGYTFDGWYSNSALTTPYSFSNAVNSNITLYAKWTENAPITYTVTFQSNGGSSISTQTIETGQTATEPTNPTRNGYSFGGWYSNSALTTPYNFGTAVTSNITLYAKWNVINTTTPSAELIALLESSGWDFTCVNNVCTYEEYSFLTYTFDLNTVTFSSELNDNSTSGDEQTQTRTIEINSSWQVDYYKRTVYLGSYITSIRVSGNGQTASYSVDSFSTNQGITESNWLSDAEGHINQLVAYLNAILNAANVTLDDLK